MKKQRKKSQDMYVVSSKKEKRIKIHRVMMRKPVDSLKTFKFFFFIFFIFLFVSSEDFIFY